MVHDPTKLTLQAALKKVKVLLAKQDSLVELIQKNGADLDYETSPYGTPDQHKAQVAGWVQAVHDLSLEILELERRIALTNATTSVTINVGGTDITRSIAAWVLRRRLLANKDLAAWNALGIKERTLKEGTVKQSNDTMKEVKIRRYYTGAERDKKVEVFRNEPSIINSALETVNATTFLVDDDVEISLQKKAA